jgi:tetratricopeptide (TPR) repeat protein
MAGGLRTTRRFVTAAVTSVAIGAGTAAGAAQGSDPPASQQLAIAGERALVEGRYTDAEEAYEALRRLTPGTGEIHARLGLIYFQQGKFADAIQPLREALRLKPGLPKVPALLAMSLSELGRFKEALPALTKAFAEPGDPVVRRMAGLHLLRAYTGLERDSDAVDVALRLSRLHPDDPEVLYHSGRLFANFAYLQTIRLASVAPDSAWLHLAAGETNESQGLHDAAIQEYRQVLRAAPRRPGVHFRIGRVLLDRAKGDDAGTDAQEARRAFEAELALDPTNANAAYELGEMARRAGDLEAARQRFGEAVAHYPAFEQALVGLGRTLIALDRPVDAIPHLQAALDKDPENHVALYQLAHAHRALGDTAAQQKALAAFTRARALATGRDAAIPRAKRDVTPQALDLGTPE